MSDGKKQHKLEVSDRSNTCTLDQLKLGGSQIPSDWWHDQNLSETGLKGPQLCVHYAMLLSSKLPPTEVTLLNTQEAVHMESKNTLKMPYLYIA